MRTRTTSAGGVIIFRAVGSTRDEGEAEVKEERLCCSLRLGGGIFPAKRGDDGCGGGEN
jgi:hypothetical protein